MDLYVCRQCQGTGEVIRIVNRETQEWVFSDCLMCEGVGRVPALGIHWTDTKLPSHAESMDLAVKAMKRKGSTDD